MVLKAAKNAIIIFLLLGIVCGVGYPALVTVIAQKAFPEQANGSIVYKDGKPVGSRLIGQEWTQPGLSPAARLSKRLDAVSCHLLSPLSR